MDKHRSYSDQSSRALKPMKPGDKVIAQNTLTKRWDTHATIISRRRDGRSYLINSDGRNYVRNRKFLRPCLIPDPPDAAEPIPAEPTTTRSTRNELAITGRSNSISEGRHQSTLEIRSTPSPKSGGHDVTPYLVAPPSSGNTASAADLVAFASITHQFFILTTAVNITL